MGSNGDVVKYLASQWKISLVRCAMGEKYGKVPNVIWETCNEPHGWSWGSGLKSYHEQVIPVIREHSSNLIVAGTNTWSQDVDEASQDQLSDSNVAYTLHFHSSMHKQPN